MNKKEKLSLEARETLKKYYWLRPSSKIYINIVNISASGMTRQMKVYNKDMQDITYYIADLIESSVWSREGVKVWGCGMDMTLWLADAISYYMFEKWVIKSKRPKTYKGNGGTCIEWINI